MLTGNNSQFVNTTMEVCKKTKLCCCNKYLIKLTQTLLIQQFVTSTNFVMLSGNNSQLVNTTMEVCKNNKALLLQQMFN